MEEEDSSEFNIFSCVIHLKYNLDFCGHKLLTNLAVVNAAYQCVTYILAVATNSAVFFFFSFWSISIVVVSLAMNAGSI